MNEYFDQETVADPGPIVIQCRFCGTKVQTHNEMVEDYLIENGCPGCQQRFNTTAERLLRLVEGLDTPMPKAA